MSSSSLPPTLRYAVGSTVVPGDRLGTIREVLPSNGTYVMGGNIYASLVGKLQIIQQKQDEKVSWTVSVFNPTTSKSLASSLVVRTGQVVLGRVTRIMTQQAIVQIIALEGQEVILKANLRPEGTIRREDIRTGATEQVQIQDSFLPGDLILCRVLSLGDSRRYFLGTAEPYLGVLRAVSASSGVPMIPVSWKEMKCPKTGITELRKCARPRDIAVT